MTEITLEKLSFVRDEIRKILKPKRYEHTLSVAYTAACLGMLYGENPLRCELAGLLHDCAKNMTDQELFLACENAGIALTDEEKAIPAVLHGIYGAYLAERQYLVDDQDILNAIRFHTTGRAEMSMLEKIIYIADFIEPFRDQAACLAEARKLAFTDIDRCMYMILVNIIEYLSVNDQPVESHTILSYNYFKAIL